MHWRHAKKIFIWDVTPSADEGILDPRAVILNHEAASIAFTSDGITLACVGEDKMTLLNVVTGTHNPKASELHGGYVYGIEFSPDGRTSASVGRNWVLLWEWDAKGNLQKTHRLTDEGAWNITFSPDAHTLATTHGPTTQGLTVPGLQIDLWDVASRTLKHTFEHNTEPSDEDIDGIAFSPDGRTLASAAGGTILLWDVLTGLHKHTYDHYSDSIAFSPDGRTLVSTGFGNYIIFLDVP